MEKSSLGEDDSESLNSSDCQLSSVSGGHHSCGSLFAECSQRGRWPLLQTFSNPESPLFRETFSDRFPIRKNENSDGVEGKAREEGESIAALPDFKTQPQKTILRLSDDSFDGSEYRRRNKMRVKFAKSFSKIEEIRPETAEAEPKWNRGEGGRWHSLSESGTTSREKPFAEWNPNRFGESFSSEGSRNMGKAKGDGGRRARSKSADKFNEDSEEKTKRRSFIYGETRKAGSTSGDPNHGGTSIEPFPGQSPSEGEGETFSNDPADPGDSERSKIDRDEKEGSLRSAMTKLKSDSAELESEIEFLEEEIFLLRKELKKKDRENLKLEREIHKLKSVLHETSIFNQEKDLFSSLQESHGMAGQNQRIESVPHPSKKQGVSGESSDHGRNHDQIEIQRFEKDFRSKQLIKDAIMENNFLKNLDSSQVREIVESVYPKEFSEGDYVIREGEAGSHLYVSAEGELEVIKNGNVLGRMEPGKAFGELAILYNCRRTASIKVVSDAKVWVLDRQVFQKIMMKTGLQRLQENLNLLRSVPLLRSLSDEVLAKIADVLEVDFYPSGEHIIRQGATGDTFFIISSGSVKVTQKKPGGGKGEGEEEEEEEEIRILNKGDYFGEQALLKEEWRTASVIAIPPGVECLTLDRESFIQLIGDLSELQEKEYSDQVKGSSRPSSSTNICEKQEYDYIRLEDLEKISTLGAGGFGRVELVQYTKNRRLKFALKCLKKQQILETKQQEHVYNERNIMMACNSPFIGRLYKTFKDAKHIYMLQEALLGGEVWTILRDKGCFDDYATKFLTGCVIEAFEYLHTRGIIYRDLKPENLLLDDVGYAKLVDFGFSKKIGFSSKTWTFCGTPEYLAPEIILNKGHDRAVDYWSLGVLMHELLTGTPPFTAPDPMSTYNIILKGIDTIEFPKHITKGAQSLIKKLCRDSPCERLGYRRGGIQDIKKHKWFQGFDWNGLKQRVLVPPITPLATGTADDSKSDSQSNETVFTSNDISD